MEEVNGEKFIENLEKVDKAILTYRDAYEVLVKIYKRYISMDERYYPVIACWILGSLFHKCFPSFPYLFLNASKQSGKSRFLKLTAYLVDGIYTVNLTEAVLFRETTPIFIDEIENITKKEKAGLRELLNVAYKKGGVVKRSRRIEKTGEIVVETFELYRPVAMANIEGMEDVLEDRCITIVLERCFDPVITRRLELFELDEDIKNFKDFVTRSVVSANVVMERIYIEEEIKNVLKNLFSYFNKTTHNNTITTHTQTTLTTDPISSLIIEKIEGTALQSRDLELFLPLFIMASKVGEDVLDQLIEFAVWFAEKRKEQNIVENRDTIAIGYLASFCLAFNISSSDFVPLTRLVKKFTELNPDEDWFNSKWLGRALKRFGKVLIEKRRLGRGREVRLNVDVLVEKAKQFGFNLDEMAEELRLTEEKQSRLFESEY